MNDEFIITGDPMEPRSDEQLLANLQQDFINFKNIPDFSAITWDEFAETVAMNCRKQLSEATRTLKLLGKNDK
jgi:hypothetical protein